MSCQLEFKVVDFPGIKYQEEEAYLIVNNQFSQSQCSKKFENREKRYSTMRNESPNEGDQQRCS
jgi:hypothetical protein